MFQIDDETVRKLQERAAASPRRRANLNLHQTLEDPVQRFLNAIEPGSYVRPHRHHSPLRWELFTALSGRAVVLVFKGDGEVLERVEITPGGPVHGVEIPAGTWHTVAALEEGTVLFEFKHGPYTPVTDKDFAAWAPAEGEEGWETMECWFRDARIGDVPPREEA